MSLALSIKRIDEMEQGISKQQHRHITFQSDRVIVHTGDNDKVYIPSKTGKVFGEDKSFVSLVMGPYGSGKTTMCLFKLVHAACQMPYWKNGRRRARAVIIRNTSGELYSTTLQSWLSWFADLGDIYKRQKPLLTYEHHFNDGYGIVELELIFLAMDREDDIRKMKSLEVTCAYINELSEVPQGVLPHLKGRLNGRYPSNQFCNEPYWSGIFADTNPPDTDHWIYKAFELDPVDGYRIFHQPPGLIKDEDEKWAENLEADNAVNLAKEHPQRKGVKIYDYYTKLASGQTQEFINVYCLGKYGSVGLGKKVFSEFNSDMHARETLEAIQGDPLYLGWDGGLTPACVVVQFTPRGQLLILREFTAEDMGVRTFAESVVLPGLRRYFPYCPKIGVSKADPSAVKRDEIMAEFSFIGELNKLGIETTPAATNNLEPRLNAIRFFLNGMVDGKPRFLISKQGCPVLYRGFTKDYLYKRVAVAGEERYRNEPDKNMSSHPHDALQYIALEFASERLLNKPKKSTLDMMNPVMRF